MAAWFRNGGKNALYTDDEIPLCTDYTNSKWYLLIFGNGISFVIVAINIVLKTIMIKLITWIGYDTHSEQLTTITNGIFTSLFVNTGLVILLVNANFNEYKILEGSLIGNIFKDGTFTDYSQAWYGRVGYSIVSTMLYNSVMPFALEPIPNITKWLA